MSRLRILHLGGLLFVTSLLAACDGTSVQGNQLPRADQPGGQPSGTLTFASRDAQTRVNNGVLKRSMAAPSGKTFTFDDLQVLVFAPMCAGCHSGGGVSQPSLFDFTTADASYQTLMSQGSRHLPGSKLVMPHEPASSYLMNSLEGRQLTGSRMPMRSAAVSDALLASIQSWIEAGAKR